MTDLKLAAQKALLPCPFCGGTPKTIERPDNIDGTEFFYAVACYCDGYSACAHKMAKRKTPEQAKADAIAAWNHRATPPLLQKEEGEPERERFLAWCHSKGLVGRFSLWEAWQAASEGESGLLAYLESQKFHPSASHVPPDYRDGWNSALATVSERIRTEAAIATRQGEKP